MSYKQINRLAFAGQIGKVGESLARSTGEQNVGVTVVHAGHFVAIAAAFGIQAMSSITTDSVAGVVVKSQLQDTYAKDEYLSVGKIGHGDSMWVVAEGVVARGDAVHIRAVAEDGKPSGSIAAAVITDGAAENPETLSIESDFIVINVADGLAEVTRKE